MSEGDSFTPSGEDGTRGLVFLFGGCSGVGGEFFHTLRRDGTRGVGGVSERDEGIRRGRAGIHEGCSAALSAFRPAGTGDSGYCPSRLAPRRMSGMTTGVGRGFFFGNLIKNGF